MRRRKRPGQNPSPSRVPDQWDETIARLCEFRRSDTAMAVLRVVNAYDKQDEATPRDELAAAVAVSSHALGGALNLLRKLGLVVIVGESSYRLGNPIGLPVMVLGEVS